MSTTTKASDLLVYGHGKNDGGVKTYPREQIDTIILSLSEGSDYFKRQKEKDHNANTRISKIATTSPLSKPVPSSHSATIENQINTFEATRRATSSCVVCDMDAFYFSCELSKGEQPRMVLYGNPPVPTLLSTIPAVVGHGMVLTSNYIARQFGVRSAMAGFIARKLVTTLSNNSLSLFELTPDLRFYVECSAKVRSVLQEYDANLRCYSLDEAYLDLAPYVALRRQGFSHKAIQKKWARDLLEKDEIASDPFQKKWASDESASDPEKPDRAMMTGLPNFQNKPPRKPAAAAADDDDSSSSSSSSPPFSPPSSPPSSPSSYVTVESAVHEMRQLVQERTNLTCSAGIAPNHMLAKIASDLNKPNGQFYVPPGSTAVLEFLRLQPTRKMGGIGRVCAKILSAFKIDTLGDLYEQRYRIHYLFKDKSATFLLRASLGWSDSHQDDDSGGQKSLSAERTFSAVSDVPKLVETLEYIAGIVWKDLQKKKLEGRCCTVKIKLSDYSVFVRSVSQSSFFASEANLIAAARSVFEKTRKEETGVRGKFELRLLGIKVSVFKESGKAPVQGAGSMLKFLSSPSKKKQEVVEEVEEEEDDVNPLADQELSLSQQSWGEEDESLQLARELQARFDEEQREQEKSVRADAAMAAKLHESAGEQEKRGRGDDERVAADLQKQYNKEDEMLSRLQGPQAKKTKGEKKSSLTQSKKSSVIDSFFRRK